MGGSGTPGTRPRSRPSSGGSFGTPADRPPDRRLSRVLLARGEGETVATALAFDLDGDCGIDNVGTLEHARGRGLAAALTAIQLHDARARGCETASLQSTPMAERLHTAAGFRDLGRILEHVPLEPRRPGATGRAVARS